MQLFLHPFDVFYLFNELLWLNLVGSSKLTSSPNPQVGWRRKLRRKTKENLQTEIKKLYTGAEKKERNNSNDNFIHIYICKTSDAQKNRLPPINQCQHPSRGCIPLSIPLSFIVFCFFTLHIIPFGQFRSAVLVLFLPSSLGPLAPHWQDKKDSLSCFCSISSACSSLLQVLLKHLSF